MSRYVQQQFRWPDFKELDDDFPEYDHLLPSQFSSKFKYWMGFKKEMGLDAQKKSKFVIEYTSLMNNSSGGVSVQDYQKQKAAAKKEQAPAAMAMPIV